MMIGGALGLLFNHLIIPLFHCFSQAQFDNSGSLTALVIWRLGDVGYVRMTPQVVAQGAAEDAHAGSVDDADGWQTGEEGLIQEAFYLVLRFVGCTADDVDLAWSDVGI